MGINYEIYGQPETWQNAYNASGINSAIATALKCGKIKVPNFDAPNTGTYTTSQIRTAVSNNKITANTPIDNSICAVGQGDKSPFKKIACHYYDENNNTWYGPYITDITTPVNMFPYETYSANGLQGIGAGATNINFATTSTGQVQIWSEGGLEYKRIIQYVTYYNANWRLAPFTYYQLKSIVLQVLVNYTTNTTEPMTDAGLNEDHWITLDDWKNTYSQYPIVGCMVRMVSANQITGDNINYYNFVGDNNSPYRSAFGLALNSPLKHNDTDTLMSYTTFKMNQLTSEVVIFNKLYNGSGWGIYTKLFLPMWDKFSQYLQKPSSKCVLYRIPYSDTVYEDLMQAVASLGYCFTPTSKKSFNVNFTDADMCIPVIDDNGITTGEYTRGTDNVNNDLYNADSVRDKGYNPITPPAPVDPNTYSDTTNWNNVDFRQAFTKRYLLTGSQVAGLATELWAAQSSKPAGIDYNNFAIDEYLTNNPIDTIVSLKYFPCTFTDTAPAIVHLGKYTTNIAATALGTSVRIIDFAPIECFSHFNDFRDYEPYTELAMYIPFCGTVKIPTAECMGNYVSVKLAIDTNTGAATGYIIVSKTGSGGICVATCQGMAAIDIPVSGLQSANLANAVFNATANWTQTQINNISANSGLFKNTGGVMGAIARGMTDSVKLSDVKGGILGGPIGAVGSLVNRLNPISALQSGLNIDLDNAKADYELSHIQVPTRLVGSASPALGCVIELDCRLIIYRPVTDENALSNYANTVGFATVQGGTVSGFSGFTVGSIDVSGINATAKEKQAIAAAFANGVYL